jgi:hypothetical protein
VALVLRTNGAPLSGALFVSNPRKRKSRSKRRNGLALRTNRRNRRNRTNRTNRSHAAMKSMRNRKNRRNRRNKLLLNYHGNGIALKANRRNRRNRRNRTNRRNSYGAFQNKLTTPAANAVGKVPVVGKMAKQYVAPLVMGVVVGGVHYGVMYGLSKIPFAAGIIEKVKPIQFTLTGVVAATALRNIPVGSKQIRDQLAVGALLAGSALDMYRFLSTKVGDLGDYEEDFDGLYEDGYIETGDLYEDGYVEVGDGGMYDVVPLTEGASVDYSGASMMDAAAAPADLSMDEGEAALSGPYSWFRRFGRPAVRQRRVQGAYSPMVGQAGHRFGWLIQLIGFARFQKMASLPPAKRVALLAQLKQQAIASVDGYSGLALDMNGLALDMSGIALDMGGLALDMNGSTLDFSGPLAGLALDMNGMGAIMHAGSTI